MTDLAGVAIALERYRFVNGGYPQKLVDLRPGILVADKITSQIMTGKPLRYRLMPSNRFELFATLASRGVPLSAEVISIVAQPDCRT